MNHNQTCPNCGSQNVMHDTLDMAPEDIILGDNDVIRWELMKDLPCLEDDGTIPFSDLDEEPWDYPDYLEGL
jgi:hypothetical protein